MPSATYRCTAVADVLVAVRSPKFHRYVNASPSGSDEPVAVRVQVRAVHTGRSITAVGATFVGGSVNVTTRVAGGTDTSPHASVSVSVTV